MIQTTELIRWLQTLPEDSSVYVDEGGLTLQCDADENAWLEVGGSPADEPNPSCPICAGPPMEFAEGGDYVCNNCTRRWFESVSDGEPCLQSRRTKVNLMKRPVPGALITDCIRPVDMGPPPDEPKREEMTCFTCKENITCPYAWDWYNIGGDCLAEK
jgi:hypothetical protein